MIELLLAAQVVLMPTQTAPRQVWCYGLPQVCVDPLTGQALDPQTPQTPPPPPPPPPAPAPPTVRERADMALVIGSLSASSVALGLTMACTADNSCRELNPVMAKFIGDGPVRATTVKAAVNGGATYLVWRFTRGKTRTLTLLALAAINTWDAAHDVRSARRTAARKGTGP